MAKQTLPELSNKIWANGVITLTAIDDTLYKDGFHVLGLSAPTINHFDTLFNEYDRKMNYSLKQIMTVITTNKLTADENVSASLYNAISKMIPPKTSYVQQNANEDINGIKTFTSDLIIKKSDELFATLSPVINDQTTAFKLSMGTDKEITFFGADNLFQTNDTTQTSIKNEVVTGNKLDIWWKYNNPTNGVKTNVGLTDAVSKTTISTDNDIYLLQAGFRGVANVSGHTILKTMGFKDNLVYIEKIVNRDVNAMYVRIRDIDPAGYIFEGVSNSLSKTISWSRNSTDLEIITKAHPVGTCLFFASNVNPNNAFAGSGTTWVNIGDDKVIRLGKADGSDVLKSGGSDSITITESNLPIHSHTYTGSVSTEPSRTIYTPADQGGHSHSVRGAGSVFSSQFGTGNTRSAANTDYTITGGGHQHTITVPQHSHTFSGTTSTRGAEAAASISVTNPYIRLMCWYRTK